MLKKTKNAKKSKELFAEDEEFDTTDEVEELDDSGEEELPEEPPIDEIEKEEEIDPDEDIESLADEATDAEEDEKIAPALPLEVNEETSAEEEAEVPEEEKGSTRSAVVKCPHCLEEVLDMDGICPLCGNPLKLTADTELTRDEDIDPLINGFDEVMDEETPSIPSNEDTLFDGLPYNQYPSNSDSN